MSSAVKCSPLLLLACSSMPSPTALLDTARSFASPVHTNEANSHENNAQVNWAVETRVGICYLPSDFVTAVIALVALVQPA